MYYGKYIVMDKCVNLLELLVIDRLVVDIKLSRE